MINVTYFDEWSISDYRSFYRYLPHSQGKTMNWNKPFETKSGLKARLLGVLNKTDGNRYTHMVAVQEGGQELLLTYDALGSHSKAPSVFDLINPPTEVSTREAFAHVYELADGTHRLGSFVYATKKEATTHRDELLRLGMVPDQLLGHYVRYTDPGKHLGVTKLNTRVKIEE